MSIVEISSSNKALQFIEKRIADNKYRGSVSSQHNRYDMQEIYDILFILNKYSPNKKLMHIRDADLSKRPFNTPEEKEYEKFCVDVKKVVGKGSQDSIRKNIFVDLHRMGLIERFDANRVSVSPFGRKGVKYVSLTGLGIRFVNETNILNRQFIFSRALDRLLGGYLEVALDIFKDKSNEIDVITKFDFMFFVSAVNSNTSFQITVAECIDLIIEFRLLSRTQIKSVLDILKKEMQPKNYNGDKLNKRDWHNWQNKIDQIYHLFNQTPYFEVLGKDKELLKLSTKEIKTRSGEIINLMQRSISAKNDYFTNHKIANKAAGFELHHIVPLSWAESPEQYKLFDMWKNLIYIDAFSHAKITHNSNRNVILSNNETTLILSDYKNNQVELTYMANVLYLFAHQKTMLDYNAELNKTV